MKQPHNRARALFVTSQENGVVEAVVKRDRDFDPVKQRSASRQFTPRYVAFETDKLMGKLQPKVAEIRTANPDSLPTSSERLQLTEKLTRLISDESPLLPSHDEQIADKQTVFAKLSDEDLREASDAVAKVNNKRESELEPVRFGGTKKGKVTANVMDTGQDTIKQYVKSLANHQVLSPEDELILGRQIQILAKWEEKRQELESDLLR